MVLALKRQFVFFINCQSFIKFFPAFNCPNLSANPIPCCIVYSAKERHFAHRRRRRERLSSSSSSLRPKLPFWPPFLHFLPFLPFALAKIDGTQKRRRKREEERVIRRLLLFMFPPLYRRRHTHGPIGCGIRVFLVRWEFFLNFFSINYPST